MTIKHNFMPRLVAASLLSLTPLLTHAASADPVAKIGKPQRSTKDGWYIGGDIGMSVFDTQRWNNWRDHYNFSTELGYKKKHLRYEIQYNHFVDKYRGFLGGTQNTSLVLGNLYYDFDNPNSKWTPFVGGGLGYMFNTHGYKAPAAQITGGVSYQVTEKLSAKFSYKQLFLANKRGVWPTNSLVGVGFNYKFD